MGIYRYRCACIVLSCGVHTRYARGSISFCAVGCRDLFVGDHVVARPCWRIRMERVHASVASTSIFAFNSKFDNRFRLSVWHFPAFIVGRTPHSEWIFVEFFVSAVVLSVIMTALFNSSKGSILLLVLLHFQLNNPIWPDAQRWVTILFTVAAIVVIIVCRKSMLKSSDAVVDVMSPESLEATEKSR